jgi:hypothetical protein
MSPDLDKEMSYWVKLLGLDKPDPVSGKPWKITWGWVDSIDLGDGRQAYGLNTVNGETQESRIDIRKLYTEKDREEFADTCIHEAAHCLGARMEALLREGKQNEAHEYIAKRLAPAFVALRDTPQAVALAKAINQWPKQAMALAKAATMPARAKGTKMDPKQVAAALALIAAASTPEEKEKLLAEYTAQINAMATDAAPSITEAPMPAAPPPAEDLNKPPMQAPAAAPLEPGYAKALDILFGARRDLGKTHRDHVEKHYKTIEGAAEYIATIAPPKPTAAPQAPAAKPLEAAPRGNGNLTTQRLGKTDNESLQSVAKALGQPLEKKMGPAILAKGKGENAPKFFTLGNLTPTEYRNKRATGWDPTKEFPRANEVMQ